MEQPITRKIGVEIECIANERDLSGQRDAILPYAEIGSDGSVEIDGEDLMGAEIRLKPFTGAEAETAIRETCKALKEAEAYVNTSCGLHVHADAGDLAPRRLVRTMSGSTTRSGEKIVYVHANYMQRRGFNEDQLATAVLSLVDTHGQQQLRIVQGQHGVGFIPDNGRSGRSVSPATGNEMLPESEWGHYYSFAVKMDAARGIRERMHNAMRFFAVADPLLRSMIPASRRRNNYCHSFEKMVRSGGAVPMKVEDIFAGIVDRYCGINMQSLHRHGTIENRYHNGTVDADKIIHWARMWARVVDIATSADAEKEADALANIVSQKSRLDMFLALLDLPEDTEKHLRSRVRAFSGADASKVKTYIKNKKALNPAATAATL